MVREHETPADEEESEIHFGEEPPVVESGEQFEFGNAFKVSQKADSELTMSYN